MRPCSGVAALLVQECERLAAEWGCRGLGMHASPANSAAWRLYLKLGYRRTVLEPAHMPYLQGRPTERNSFLLKVVGSGPISLNSYWRKRQQQPQQQQQA